MNNRFRLYLSQFCLYLSQFRGFWLLRTTMRKIFFGLGARIYSVRYRLNEERLITNHLDTFLGLLGHCY